MKRYPKQNDDDGRVICNMNVDGMPWHDRSMNHREEKAPKVQPGELTRSEASQFTWYALAASLLVVTVFSLTWVLFVLFCTKIWFR